jgi:hypothetical protein
MISDEQIERAARVLERYNRRDYEWTDDQFENWWNHDARCDKSKLKEQVKVVLQSIKDNRQVKHYIVVSHRTIHELHIEVNGRINEGWICVGGVQVVVYKNDNKEFFQAMVIDYDR